MWRLAIAFGLAGCNSLLGIHDLTNVDPGDDAAVGDGTPTTDGMNCYGSPPFDFCLTALPTGPQVLSGLIDTDTSALCGTQYTAPAGTPNLGSNQSGGPWCVVVGITLAVSTTTSLQATGSRPLVLVATGDLTIDGLLDASSHKGFAHNGIQVDPINGPAANMLCDPAGAGTSPANLNTGGGGGAGGSFATSGGNGGNGDTTGIGGIAASTALATSLRGGCPGGLGAPGAASGTNGCYPMPSGPPGSGGGAVYLVAGGTVHIDGQVVASGAGGGQGYFARGGGSGGGSGGLIVVWAATTIEGRGELITSGGGGGGGADQCATASPGSDPPVDMTTSAAGGLGADSSCPVGGVGAAGSIPGGGAGKADDGGTGGTNGGSAGGGGLGFVVLHAAAGFAGSISGMESTL